MKSHPLVVSAVVFLLVGVFLPMNPTHPVSAATSRHSQMVATPADFDCRDQSQIPTSECEALDAPYNGADLAWPNEALTTMTFNPDHDATIDSNHPTINYGGANTLELSWSNIGGGTREGILLHFNVSSIPANAEIDSASLEIRLTGASGQMTVDLPVYFVTGPSSWLEGSVTWNSVLAMTVAASPWNFSINSTIYGYKTVDITSYVNAWRSNPSQNYGVLILAPNPYSSFTRTFESDEFNYNRPRLVVDYHVPTLSGRVYEGNVYDESTPREDVTVALYCSSNANVQGRFVTSTTTDEFGWYGLPVEGICQYYNIVETVPTGYDATGATAVSQNWRDRQIRQLDRVSAPA